MRTKNSINNTITALIASFCSAFLGIISQALFLRILNIEYLGVNGLFNNVLSMLSIAELGIGSAITVNLYKPLYENNKEKIKSLMHFYKKAYNIIAIFILTVGLLLIPFLGKIVGEVSIDINLTVVYLLFLFGTVSSYLLNYKRSILYANQKNYILNISQIFYLTIYNILQIIILYITKNYYLYLSIKIICQLLENLAISIYVNIKYKYLKEKEYKKLSTQDQKNIFTKVKALFIHKIADFFINGTDNIIISTFLNVATVGLYSNYYTIINSVNHLFSKIIYSTSASVGNLLVEGDKSKVYKTFNRIRFLNFWIATFSSTCLLVIMQSFIVFWVGKKYLLDNFALYVLVLNYYLNLMRNSYSTFKDAAGIWQEDKYIPILRAILNIVFSIIFVKLCGLSGVFIGTILSSLVLWCYSYPKYIHKQLLKKDYKSYIKDNFKYLILFLLIATLSYQISMLITINNILLKVIINTTIAVIVPNILIVVFFYKNANFKYFINLIKNIFKKRKKQGGLLMKRLTMEEIRKIQLEELLYIKEICDKNNIDYFITSGTLLGAVKYKGYIPWDDDIDIGVKREEYRKLINILQKEDNKNYKVLSIYNTKDYYYIFAKLVHTKTKLYENTKEIKHMGVYIDIFPFDYYNDNYEEFLKKTQIIRNLSIRRYRIKNNIEKSKNIAKVKKSDKNRKIKDFVYTVVDFLTLPLGYKFWVKQYDKLISKNTTGKYTTMGCRGYVKFDSKLFQEFVEYEFEGYKFKGIKDADTFLKNIYGDYMKDLPKDEQRTHHQMKAYWKE